MSEPGPPVVTQHQRRSSIQSDGRREKLRLGDVAGWFTTRRQAFFYALIAVFALLPLLRVHGAPLIFLDILHRRFYLFGDTFNAQDTYLLFFLLASGIVTLFIVTALVGRAWCGWACPQTVYLEGVFRRIERLVEGPKARQLQLAKAPWGPRKAALKLIKHGLYLAAAVLVSNIFISYFVSFDQLRLWVLVSPAEHLTAFGWMAAITGALYFDLAWFREQTCVVICPYGRLQSALTDDDTLVVGYDAGRGEPRGHLGAVGAKDCIDCGRCVDVCPTGIDIREGLQLECIACANCIDACDAIMVQIGRPKGLVRYDSLMGLQGSPQRFLRPRIYAYAGILAMIGLLAVLFVARRRPFEATLIRQQGLPYSLDHGVIRNTYLLHLVNKTRDAATFKLELELPDGAHGLVPLPVVPVASLGTLSVPLDVELPAAQWHGGFEVAARTTDLGTGKVVETRSRFLGPDR
jgi:cytochrome c oxidase accessory protein FixG